MVGYIVITVLDTFWKNSQWVAQAHDDYIVNKIVKETRGSFQKVATGYIVIIIMKELRVFIQKVATHYFGVFFVKMISMYPLSTFWSKWWIHFKKTQHISPGFWLDKLLKKSQLNHNVSTDCIPPCPQWVAHWHHNLVIHVGLDLWIWTDTRIVEKVTGMSLCHYLWLER